MTKVYAPSRSMRSVDAFVGMACDADDEGRRLPARRAPPPLPCRHAGERFAGRCRCRLGASQARAYIRRQAIHFRRQKKKKARRGAPIKRARRRTPGRAIAAPMKTASYARSPVQRARRLDHLGTILRYYMIDWPISRSGGRAASARARRRPATRYE